MGVVGVVGRGEGAWQGTEELRSSVSCASVQGGLQMLEHRFDGVSGPHSTTYHDYENHRDIRYIASRVVAIPRTFEAN